jgi:hypothetical protein
VDRYVRGVDDGPPQQFSTIADAKKAAGFDFPDAGPPSGWKIQTVIVTPVFYARRVLDERPELMEGRAQQLRDAVASGRFPPGVVYFWLTDGVPDPASGLHNYVTVAYASENGAFISLDFNQQSWGRQPFAPMAGVTSTTKQSVRVGSAPASLITYRSQSSEAFIAEWRLDHVSIRATAFNGSPNPIYRMTADDFIAFLANVR